MEPSEKHALDDIDDLGYYADGNKRTLTDEQIAIFRHTEIQELLKIHEAASYDESPSPIASSNIVDGVKSAGKPTEEPESIAGAEGIDAPTPQTFNSESTKVDTPKTSDSKASKLHLTAKSERKVRPKGQEKKKSKGKRPTALAGQDKRHDPKKYKTEGDERTFRRIAREMDDYKDAAVDLDY
jgi:hypothetical protein